MARLAKSINDTVFLTAALEGLEAQRRRIDEQIEQVRTMLGGRKARASAQAVGAIGKPAKRRRLSAAARKRIAMAQKRRWAEYRKKTAAKS